MDFICLCVLCRVEKKKKKIYSPLFTWVSLAGTHPVRTPLSPVLLQKIKLSKISREENQNQYDFHLPPCVLAVVMQSNFVVHKIYIMHLFKKMVHK